MLKQLQKKLTAEATCQNNAAFEGGVQHAMEFTLLINDMPAAWDRAVLGSYANVYILLVL